MRRSKRIETLDQRPVNLDGYINEWPEMGFVDVAESVLSMLKQRVVGDYMQTAAILDKDFHVLSGINTPNDYMGPGTGYRVQGERWEEIKKIPHIINPQDI